jgi:hypothetical protein
MKILRRRLDFYPVLEVVRPMACSRHAGQASLTAAGSNGDASRGFRASSDLRISPRILWITIPLVK